MHLNVKVLFIKYSTDYCYCKNSNRTHSYYIATSNNIILCYGHIANMDCQ